MNSRNKRSKPRKILYLQGRPEAHKLHGRFAKSLGSEVNFIDFKKRWQDENFGFIKNFYCWIVNALSIPTRGYQYFLIDNLHVTAVIMKILRLKKGQKIIVHLGSHTLYFMFSNQFSRINNWLHKWALKKYDALICEGQMASELAHSILGSQCPKTYTTFLGPPEERLTHLLGTTPNFNSTRIILLAAGPTAFRAYYKGLDIMLKAFSLVFIQRPDVHLDILGHWEDEVKFKELSKYNENVRQRIHFHGRVDNIQDYFANSCLCLHTTRGDAFPTATVEAMTAGIPTIVSDWTGTKEIVGKVDGEYIVPLDSSIIAENIINHFNLDLEEKTRLSKKFREIASEYTEESAITHYKQTFLKIESDLSDK